MDKPRCIAPEHCDVRFPAGRLDFKPRIVGLDVELGAEALRVQPRFDGSAALGFCEFVEALVRLSQLRFEGGANDSAPLAYRVQVTLTVLQRLVPA